MSSRIVVQFCLKALVVMALGGHVVAQTTIYRHVDKDGNVTFTDQSGPGREQVRVTPVQTYTPPAASVPKPRAGSAGKDQTRALSDAARPTPAYTRFEIASPSNEEAIRNNAGAIKVGVRVEPTLAPNDRVQLLIDGKPLGEPTRSTIVTSPNIDRGTHTLSARLVDKKGNTRAVAPGVTFHLIRASVVKR